MTNREKFTEIFGCEIVQRDTGEAIPGHCVILIASDKHFNEWLKQEYVQPSALPSAQPEIIRCKDCSKWCICHHSDNWFCADGTPINTASDFYDDKGKRLNNPQTYKSIYGERKDGDGNE